MVPLSHITKILEFKSKEWTSPSYTSIRDVDTKDEEVVDVSNSTYYICNAIYRGRSEASFATATIWGGY